MAIIYRKPKGEDGPTYAYDSTSYWVKDLGQPRSTRKYLGVVDESTGEIIPSSGKRGRKSGSKQTENKSAPNTFSDSDLLDAKDQEIRELRQQVEDLKKENRQYQSLLQKIHTISQIEK